MKTNQTTRQHRRVVWLFAETFLAFTLAFAIGRVILLRTTLASLAPEGTDLTVSLVGKGGRELLTERFLQEELVSGRPVTIGNLANELGRETALFFDLDTGSHSLALSSHLSDELTQTLKINGISVTLISGATFLRADSTQNPKSRHTSFHLASIFPNYIGWTKTTEDEGAVRFTNNKLILKVYTGVDKEFPKTIPEETTSASIVHAWTGLEAYAITAGGDVLLTSDAQGTGYRITINEAVETQNLAKILKESAMNRVVELAKILLPDSSSVTELVVDPQRVSIEINEQDDLLRMVAMTEKGEIFARREGAITIVTNRQELLEKNPMATKSLCFIGAGSYIFPSALNTPALGFLKNTREIAISKDFLGICW